MYRPNVRQVERAPTPEQLREAGAIAWSIGVLEEAVATRRAGDPDLPRIVEGLAAWRSALRMTGLETSFPRGKPAH